MKILVVGVGGREHAIAWKLSQSPNVDDLLVAPGNAGTARIARNVAVPSDDIESLLRLAEEEAIDLTVVGPERPLAAGIADRFAQAGRLLFGPSRAAARIETSKSFAKALMLRHGVPTGSAEVFDDYEDAASYLRRVTFPVVVKADGLAAGKGVVVAATMEAAIEALRRQMVEGRLGAAGDRVLIEEYLEGQEISVFAFVDGEHLSPLVAACDYKSRDDGGGGPNTGGMGAYSPPPPGMWNEDIERDVRTTIMEPVVQALSDLGTPYAGVLYAGLMLTSGGPKVIEFNCRMGDPEAQVLLPRLITDLADVMIRTARGELGDVDLQWDRRACVGVVIASGGYPDAYETGFPIAGLDGSDDDTIAFHASTAPGRDGAPELVSDGGRVVTIAALGETLAIARAAAYRGAAAISFEGSFYRNDIALMS